MAVLATMLGACDGEEGDEDAGRDAGGGDEDAGPLTDAGPLPVDAGPDAGSDAGPLPSFSARLVNNVPGFAALDVCLWQEFGGNIIGEGTWVTDAPPAVPFRGVSSYLPGFVAVDGLDYIFALYDASTFGGACPADPEDASAIEAAFIGRVLSTQVEADATYSMIATGFAPDTLGGADGALPSLCDPNPADGVTFTMPCDEDANGRRLIVVEDDLSDPAADMIKIRFTNQVPNSPPLELLVCYDADLIPNPDTAMRAQGSCIEPASLSAPELLSGASVAFGEVTDYVEADPIDPTDVPVAGVGGGLYLALVPSGTTTCPAFADLPVQRCFPIVSDEMRPTGLNEAIQTNLTAGDVITVFIQGAFGVTEDTGTPPAEDYRVKFFPWQDNFVPDP